MDQFEREDSSTYTEPEQTPVSEPTNEAPAQPPVQEAPKPKKSKTPLVLTLLLLLALVAAGTFGWMWFQQSGRVDNLETDLSKARNDVSRLETAAKAEDSLDDSAVTPDTEDSDSEAIIKAALAHAQAPKESTAVSYKTEIMYNKGGFARVSVSAGESGFAQILKKVNDEWVVIVEGQNEPTSDDVKTYGIPQAVVDSYKM